jgi:hypothetical protein
VAGDSAATAPEYPPLGQREQPDPRGSTFDARTRGGQSPPRMTLGGLARASVCPASSGFDRSTHWVTGAVPGGAAGSSAP